MLDLLIFCNTCHRLDPEIIRQTASALIGQMHTEDQSLFIPLGWNGRTLKDPVTRDTLIAHVTRCMNPPTQVS
jgi:hypothetical protein